MLVGTKILLRLYGQFPHGWDLVNGPGNSSFVPDPGSGNAVSFALAELTGQSTGEVYGKLVVGPGQRNTHALHATVHDALLRLFVAHPAITMETTHKDRQIPVFAEFQTGAVTSTHDITGHSYLDYAVTGLAGVTVDADGFVATGTATGTATITVTQKGVSGGPSATVALTVVAEPATRDILVVQHAGTAQRRVSILMLAEGFVAAEQTKFEDLVKHVTRRLTRDTSPYNLLRESLHIFTAFVPSQESGASIGPPVVLETGHPTWGRPVVVARARPAGTAKLLLYEVVHHLGYPPSPPPTFAAARAQLQPHGVLDQHRYDTWISLRQLRYTRPRNTAFGLVVGQRNHAAPTGEIGANRTAAADLLFERAPYRAMTVDDRRIPTVAKLHASPENNFIDVQNRFVKTLRVAGDSTPYGNWWEVGASAGGLVIYIVNTNASQGVRDIPYVMLSNGGGAVKFPVTPSTIVPGFLEAVPVANVTRAHNRHGMYAASADRIASVVAHELAHTEAFGTLHDEYTESGTEFHAPPPPVEQTEITRRVNVQLLAAAQAPGNQAIRADLLKWNWERAEAGAVVTALIAGTVEVEIEVEDLSRWPTTSVGRQVFLRLSDLAVHGRSPSPLLAIQHVDVAARTIRVAMPAGHTPGSFVTAFQGYSRLVMPLMSASSPRHLVDPIMIGAMTGGPFAASLAGCSENPDQRPPLIPVFQYPRNHSYTIAAYESGANRHCGVIRGAGECVMRNAYEDFYNANGIPIENPKGATPAEFCFVCKYAIVDKVNAALHGQLDKEYPQ